MQRSDKYDVDVIHVLNFCSCTIVHQSLKMMTVLVNVTLLYLCTVVNNNFQCKNQKLRFPLDNDRYCITVSHRCNYGNSGSVSALWSLEATCASWTAMDQLLTSEGLHFPTCRNIQRNYILLNRLQTRQVLSQEVLPTSGLLAQCGDLAVLYCILSFSSVSVFLPPSFRTFFGFTLHISVETPPLCLNALLVSLSPLFLFIIPCSALFLSFSLSCIVFSTLSHFSFL